MVGSPGTQVGVYMTERGVTEEVEGLKGGRGEIFGVVTEGVGCETLRLA